MKPLLHLLLGFDAARSQWLQKLWNRVARPQETMTILPPFQACRLLLTLFARQLDHGACVKLTFGNYYSHCKSGKHVLT